MSQIVNSVPPAQSRVTQAVPELLDYIVPKMMAEPIEERYADAAEVARDLRECERQLAIAGAPINPAAATHIQPLTPAAMPPQPTLVDAAAKTSVLVQPVSRTREADRVIEAPAPAPAHGVAASFDSMEATQRLASLTGPGPPQKAPQAIKSMPPGPRGRR